MSWGVIAVLVLAINLADYLVGVSFSLSLLYLLPVSLSAGWLGSRAGIIVACFSTTVRLAGDVATIYPAAVPAYLWWNVGAALLIFLFVVWLVDTLVSAYHALEGRIAARTGELAAAIADRRRLELEILDVTARERAAIGRELHDELGQHLVATALAAQVLAQQLGQERGGREAQSIVQWIEQAIAKTRKLARGLLIARIERDRFASELEELATNASQGGVQCRVQQQGDVVHATPAECAQLFRIAQEAIGNALRHGRAKTVDITIASDAQASCLLITDDGVGFRPTASTDGMGLRIMEHRAQIIGASLAVLSAPGQGTKVVCRLPARTEANP